MPHEFAVALQQAGRVRQSVAMKESHIYVRCEYVNVAEGRVSQAGNRTAVMQKFPDLVPAFSHHLKPIMSDGSQRTCMFFHPCIDGRIAFDGTIESEQVRTPGRRIL